MTDPARQSLGADLNKPSTDAGKRKMTAAILDDQEKQKEVYEFLEEDDDFEEFETNYEGQLDVEMGIGGGLDADKQLWRQDWDDEHVEEDF